MVCTLSFNTFLLGSFYSINCVGDFIIDMVLSSPSTEVRVFACKQFCRLGKIKASVDSSTISAKQFLLQVLLKAPLPLWVSTTNTRGTSQR